MRWEYLLLGTDKPHLSILDDDDDNLIDDDDVENLVSLTCLGGWGQGEAGGFILGSGWPDKSPASMHAYGRGQSR